MDSLLLIDKPHPVMCGVCRSLDLMVWLMPFRRITCRTCGAYWMGEVTGWWSHEQQAHYAELLAHVTAKDGHAG